MTTKAPAKPRSNAALLREAQRLEAALAALDRQERLKRTRFLPSQQKLIDAYNDPAVKTILFLGANQSGKTDASARCLCATALGVQPWDNRPRRFRPPVRIAVLLEDYDNHAFIYAEQKVIELMPPGAVEIIERTQRGAPRVLRFKETGSTVHLFTKDQESRRLESATWHELYVDEPCARSDFIALSRGLQKFDGKTVMTMTPLSEPWIFDEIYTRAGNLGGDKGSIFAITTFPDENKQSQGGYLSDAGVDEFRAKMSEEEREARVHGRFLHLLGRVYKNFDESIHVLKEHPVPAEERCHGVTIDPHDRLPWAIAWFYVTPGGDIVFYDEWPHEAFEEIRDSKLVVNDYAKILKDHGSTVYRFMDPNAGRRRSVLTGMTIAEAMQALSDEANPLFFETRINDDLQDGHESVRSRLAWNKDKPRDPSNQPRLYFLDSCRNLIRSLRSYIWEDWRGKVGEGKPLKEKPQEKFKHFPDCVRYTCIMDPRWHTLGRTEPLRREGNVIHFRPGWEGGDLRWKIRERLRAKA
jgi:hypothetical protein